MDNALVDKTISFAVRIVNQSLKYDADEMMRIIISSIKTAKKNLEYENK